MEHLGTAVLETPRLLLRPFRAGDGAAMYRNWCSDEEVTRYLTWQPHANPEQSEALARVWEEESRKPEFYQWAVVLKELGEPIGSLSVVRRQDETCAAELGYCIGRTWWGRGLMPEAVRAVCAYLIERVGMNRVSACHDADNPKSGRVMQKAGMRYEGTLRAAGKNNRGICDLVYYSMLADEIKRDSEK